MCSLNDNLVSIEYVLYPELNLNLDLPKKIVDVGFVCISRKNDLLSLAQSGLNDNFHWYVCSSFCNRSRVVSRAIYFRKSSGRSKSEAPKQGHAKKFQNYEITPKESIYLKQLKIF